jgi:beta-lactam-binding protein with PASTA domain
MVLLIGCSPDEASEPPSDGRPGASGSAERTMLTQASAQGQLAEANGSRVPRLVGMRLSGAISELRRADYGCAVSREEGRGGSGPRRVVAQDPRAGARGFEGQLVQLTVSRPFPDEEGAVPPRCVDQRHEPWSANAIFE